jgi:hypothetical protein
MLVILGLVATDPSIAIRQREPNVRNDLKKFFGAGVKVPPSFS